MTMTTPHPFPQDFVWGAATSSYQIEGASAPDQRGPSVWDAFCTRPGAVYSAHSGHTACDHVRLFDQDVAFMADMRLNAYRFSISWPRVIPQGTGDVNPAGLDFYDRLVDALLEHSITPWATLFHWDFPLALFERGGWLNRDSARWFADYARVVVDRLSDRVTHWITINEPQVVVQLGHAEGTHAPGLRLPFRQQLAVAHNLLRAHGAAAAVIRAHALRPPLVGWAPVGHVSCPVVHDAHTIAAAREATFRLSRDNLWNNSWYADPVVLGHYPADGLRLFEKDLPTILQNDLAEIRQPLDFFGVNIYSGAWVRTGPDAAPEALPTPPGAPRTSFNWTVCPEALRYGPQFLYERYKLPIVITENGMANLDWVDLAGRINDPQRIDFTRRYLISLSHAIADGVDIRGYFHWSLLDNFEWAEGYKERFGLIHVDFATLQRTPKRSAYWYRRVIESNGLSLADDPFADSDLPAPSPVPG
jgi:beta-glucosidase